MFIRIFKPHFVDKVALCRIQGIYSCSNLAIVSGSEA